MKTIKNNLEKSKPGGTRCLWNNGQHLWWSSIYNVYREDGTNQRRMTKLRDEHVRLTPAARMSVRLGVQVLSRSVGLVLQQYGGPDVIELSEFIVMSDRFFDCLDVRSFNEHINKRKPDLAPYRRLDDERFQVRQI
ncbi:uncharacterized protein LOC141902104 [Tubulanus polymorphus]|uniref:uncharacterized protein LOC141902104 n=1 Tax=Tubulanus polymorphus TaxID=672921 RepID=UPI003DA67E63